MINNYKHRDILGIRKGKRAKNHFVRSDSVTVDLKMLRIADICACNTDELIDLRDVKVNRKASSNRRTDDFVAQVKNPYLFKVGETVVKVTFGDGKDFSKLLADVILAG